MVKFCKSRRPFLESKRTAETCHLVAVGCQSSDSSKFQFRAPHTSFAIAHVYREWYSWGPALRIYCCFRGKQGDLWIRWFLNMSCCIGRLITCATLTYASWYEKSIYLREEIVLMLQFICDWCCCKFTISYLRFQGMERVRGNKVKRSIYSCIIFVTNGSISF